MKIGKEIKQPKEIKAMYNDNSGFCGNFVYNEKEVKWKYEHKWKEMDEKECFSAYKNLKKLNSKKMGNKNGEK